ncbi:bifunctional proline dehydrogenase/L-glutamate gamma-semialdehyde dehydrogenase PutA [Swaminathania salitolerans]|uniref:Bifunctional protein PutA n=1 Tax=Swaminathania salitolerans TaxID=182838 RepID=A0A511BWG4_9PROT|nr:bifunctional proline dehydrogenase/L-glutamate gamma-semialdehyde dehydrogenase PutA [Swaminathania salitolerans]GBQ13555.1 bifunctional proline dehydrogenase/pyrroline-5-carboxylate dehydrogenase [Swaminathania salitolerans LMG 21291]GEL02348.1 bifunctional protein PutA [Swaminathania salitolerans]
MTAFATPLSTVSRSIQEREALRQAVSLPEASSLAPMIDRATLPADSVARVEADTRFLTERLRARLDKDGAETMMQAFPLGTVENTALLSLTEALLRIPDAATRDLFIREMVGQGDWQHHAGHDRPLFLGAAAWAMASATDRDLSDPDTKEAGGREPGPGGLRGFAARSGAPFIRHGVERAIRRLGAQFIPDDTLGRALRHCKRDAQGGFVTLFALMAPQARTRKQAERAVHLLTDAIETVGRHARGSTPTGRPGVTFAPEALHPRFETAFHDRVVESLAPVLIALAARARTHDIGFQFDAGLYGTLDLSLSLFTALCEAPELSGWDGLGFTVQASGKWAMPLIDLLTDLATRTGRRIMLRLVKGQHWEEEIRLAQTLALPEYPVFTRKCHTDVSYIACARKLLERPDAIFPQFATQDARAIATIRALADLVPPEPDSAARLEFQCRRGIGEALHASPARLPAHDRPRNGDGSVRFRMLTPFGEKDAFSPYVMDRLFEIAAPSGFLNRATTRTSGTDTWAATSWAADPAIEARAILPRGAPNPELPLPIAPGASGPVFDAVKQDPPTLQERWETWETREIRESWGQDVNDPVFRIALGEALADRDMHRLSGPIGPAMPRTDMRARIVRNPADQEDHVGTVLHARPRDIDAALNAAEAERDWRRFSPDARARCLEAMARAVMEDRFALLALLIREAGKTVADARDELRETIDFLNFYASELRALDGASRLGAPLGIVLCISPWNFPLSILTGQIAAALGAGNAVIAKPAEETPLIAAHVVRLFLAAGLPPGALQLLPGEGNVGASLVADSRIDGVMFTGSTAVAKTISRELLGRTGRTGQPVPLLADTSGQNAMLVDSTAATDRVVSDVLRSAFNSAGQRSASLRILLVQEDCADALIERLLGAMAELRVAAPEAPDTDIGPVISSIARVRIEEHVARMGRAGHRIWQPPLEAATLKGHFVPPTLIEIGRIADLGTEIFGPVLHIRRFARHELEGTIDALNATGYALTFGVQSRVPSTLRRCCARSRAGNLYVNRAMIGARVGSQPYGGKGMSGSGPKAGGPLLLPRLTYGAPCPLQPLPNAFVPPAARALLAFLEPRDPPSARRLRGAIAHGLCGYTIALPGPAGETNRYSLQPRGTILCAGESWPAVLHAVGLALATGNTVLVLAPDSAVEWLGQVSRHLSDMITRVDPGALPECDAMLIQRGTALADQAALTVTAREGRVVPVHDLDTVRPEWLLSEVVLTTNTAVLGADAALLALR